MSACARLQVCHRPISRFIRYKMLTRLLRPTIRSQTVAIHLRCLSTAPSTPHAFLSRSADPKHSGISFLTLDRPAAKNSLSVQLLQDFRAALDEVRFDG